MPQACVCITILRHDLTFRKRHPICPIQSAEPELPLLLFTVPRSTTWRPAYALGAFLYAVAPMKAQDDEIRSILTSVKTIALVGWSPKPDRPSHRVAAYLAAKGYRVIPVNPGQAGEMALGEQVRAQLSDIDDKVDMIDIFRRSEEVGPLVDEALSRFPALTAIWMQLGVEHAGAAQKAQERGVKVVMNRCPAIEIPRLGL